MTPNDPRDEDTGPNGLQNFPVLGDGFSVGPGGSFAAVIEVP